MTAVMDELDRILSQGNGAEAISKLAYFGLAESQKSMFASDGYRIYRGKVRELLERDGHLYIFHTDRLTAFDKYIGMVPFKGLILSEISGFWLKNVNDIVPTHFEAIVNERVLRVKACKPLKAEIVVRSYLAGSMARAYQDGVREFCGCKLPEGLKPFQKLPEPIITPTTKAAAFEHDQNISPSQMIEQGICTSEEWQTVTDMALKLFARGQDVFRDKGWILVDSKYEFGWDPEGQLCVIDEIHTPDSSRLWVQDSYVSRQKEGLPPEMLDKEIVRRYLLDRAYSGEGPVPDVPAEILVSLAKTYLRVAETLMGRQLQSQLPPNQISI